MNQTITATIMSPVAKVWEIQVSAISAENSEGTFDILPGHARFMSLINNGPVVFELLDGSEKEFTFENAVLFFKDNIATIYVQELLKELRV